MRLWSGLKGWSVAAVAATLLFASPAQAVRDFQARYTNASVSGDIALIGNMTQTCSPALSSICVNAQNGGNFNNNSFTMVHVDVDSDSSTFNSSSATLSLPSGSSVLFAGLYWAGVSTANARQSVKFSTPAGSGYRDIDSTVLDTSGSNYQGFADVTSLVAAAGNGVYMVGNINSVQSAGNWSGWALVVAYRNSSLPTRNLNVFDGFLTANNANIPVDISISGFLTPAAGTVNSTIGVVAYEGDLATIDGSAGLQFGQNVATLSAVSNAVNPVNNFFNSTISLDGTNVTTGRNPAYINTLGFDLDVQAPNTPLPNGATTALVRVRGSSSEVILPGVITLSTDVFVPNLKDDLSKTAVDLNGGVLLPGDVIEYTLSTRNTGKDPAKETVLRDVIPANTTFVPGSLSVTAGANTGNKTDAAGDDQAEFDSANNRVVIRLGSGANASTGGQVGINETVSAKFRVKVNANVRGETIIPNQATLTYRQVTLGGVVSDNSDGNPNQSGDQTTDVVVASPDLVIDKAHTGDFAPGQVGASYTLAVKNQGTAPTFGTVTVDDSLPAGLAATALSGSGWACTLSPLRCTRSDALAAGASYPVITLTVNVAANASGTLNNTASVTNGAEGPSFTGNNSDTDPTLIYVNPNAVDDSASTPQNTAVTVSVLANDTGGTFPLDSASVSIVSNPTNGTVAVNSNGTVTYTPKSNFSGSDSLVYKVCDKPAAPATPHCDTATVSITVNPNTLTLQNDSASTAQNLPVSISVLANDSASGAPLDPASVTITANPANGTVLVNADGTVTYTPATNFSGTNTFTYRVCDRSLPAPLCGTAQVRVTVAANTVTANNDSASTAQNTAATINVLANDSSTGAPLDPASVSITANPTNGTVLVNADGSVRYTPAANFSGSDSFKYRVCDKSLPTPVCATATVNITVSPNTVNANDDSASTAQNTAITVTVLGNDSTTGAPLDSGSVSITANPANGTVLVNADGTVRYTPRANFSGNDSFQYRVCDTSTPTRVCDTATVTISVAANQVNTANDQASTPQNMAVTVNVLANDSSSGAALDPGSVRITANPAHGSATVNADGSVKYTPANNYAGPDSFSYEVCDTSTPTRVCSSAVVSITVTANVVNAQDDSASTAQNTAVTVAVLANDTVTGAALNPASLSISANPAHGSVAVNADGSLRYTPASNFSGTDTFSYKVCDQSTPTPVCDTATVTVSVAANTVSAQDDSASTAQNTAVSIGLLANDSSTGAPLNTGSVSISTNPANGTVVVNGDGSVRYTPATNFSGRDGFNYRVCDTSTPTPVCATARVSVSIAGNSLSAQDDTATTAQNTAATINVLANDTVSGVALDTSSLRVLTAPSHGTVTVNADGTVQYTPQTNFSGQDSFQYEVCDSSVPTRVCDQAVVTVAVGANQVVAADDQASTAQNTAVTLNLLANDSSTGAPLDPASLTITASPAHGTVSNNGDGTVSYTPAGNFSGSDSFSYRICDKSIPTPVCDTAIVSITVSANRVMAQNDSATTPQNTAVTVNVLANDSSTGAALDAASASITANPAHGTVTVNADGSVKYTPATNYAGTDSFSYRVCDSSNPTAVCATARVDITVSPNTVNAQDDSASTTQNTPVTVTVLTNDSATGAPLNAGSVSITANPAHGTVTVNADGTVRYSPATNFSGTDSFFYKVCDRSSPTPVCDTATATVAVGANQVVAADDSASTPQNTAVTVNLLDNDRSTGAPLDPASLSIGSGPAHGTVTLNADHTASYTPATNFSGNDSFTYKVCDKSVPTPVCDTARVNITVQANTVNAQDDSASTPQNAGLTLSVLANDTAASAPLDTGSLTITASPANGTARLNADGTVTYTPRSNFSGTDRFSYKVCDRSTPTPVCDMARVTVLVAANTVTAQDDAASTAQNLAVTLNVLVNDNTVGAPLDLASLSIVANPANGTVSVGSNGNVTYTPKTNFSGTDVFRYQVCDRSSPTPVCDTALVTVVVVANQVLAANDLASVPQNGVTTINVLANDSSIGAPLDPHISITSNPAHGTVLVNGDGTVKYTPAENFSGMDSFKYQVCDISNPTPVCATATVTVFVAPNIVNAQDDSASTPQNTAVTVNVLANDTAIGSALDPASLGITGNPANGTVVVNADHTVSYTPATNFSGTDHFSYRVCDSSTPTKVCDSATVTVVVARNQVVASDDQASTPQNTAVTIAVLADDSSSGAPLDKASLSITTQPTHGTVLVNADGTVKYTPATNYSGADGFDYQICDSSVPTRVCDSAHVSITVQPNRVTAQDDTANTAQNAAVAVSVLANDTVTGASLDKASLTVVATPQNGTVVVNADGSITYTPATNFSGDDSFSYKVCDSSTPTPVCDNATVKVSVAVNQVVASDDQRNTPQNKAVVVDVLANDHSSGAPLDTASVTVTANPAHGSVAVNSDGTITYTPNANFSGNESFKYQVCDKSVPTKVCATATVSITVARNTVNAQDDSVTTPQNTAVTVDVLANDGSTGAALDAASVTVTANPANGTVTVAANGNITYTPAPNFSGSDSFTYQVCDVSTPTRVCDTAKVTVQVGANQLVLADDAAETAQNAAVTLNVLANDRSSGAPLDPASLTLNSTPANGTATVNAGGSITYTPASNFSGTNSFTYKVCDQSVPTPVCASATVTVTVKPNQVAAQDDNASTTQNTAVTLNLLANDSTSHAPLDPASLSITGQPTHGTLLLNADQSVRYTPATNYSGTDSFSYKVCDQSTPTPVCDSATATITIAPNQLGVADDEVTTAQNTAVTVNVLANDTVTGAPLDPASVSIFAQPTHGTVAVNSDGSIRYTPASNYSGSDAFSYQVCDKSTPTPLCAKATVSVTVSPNHVTAQDDSATTPQNTALNIAVLGNDSATHAAIDPATLTITTNPANGSVAINGDHSVRYTPATNFSGSDTFRYKVCDSSNPDKACDDALVTIAVDVNRVVAADDEARTAQNTAVTVKVLDNDSSASAPLDSSTLSISTQPANGTVTVNADGSVTYTPKNNFSGSDSFAYQICDSSKPTALCATANVAITVNANGVSAQDDAATTPQNTARTISVLANDSSTGAALDKASLAIVTAPANGTAAVNSDGSITYTPKANFSGTDTFTYKVCDSSNPSPVCAEAKVTVTVPVNSVTAQDDSGTADHGPVTLDVLANDKATGAPLNKATLKIVTQPANGTVQINGDGTVTYTPNANFGGSDSFRYEICDSSNPTPVCAQANVAITVSANRVVAADDEASTPQNTAKTINVLANDTGSNTVLDPASVSVTAAPANGGVTVNGDGSIRYTPKTNFSGTDTFNYQVCDKSTPNRVCATAKVTVTVQANVLTVQDDSASSANGGAVTVPVLANDSTQGAALDKATLKIVTAPANGTAVVNADGTISYTPRTGFSGTDTLVYEVCDSSNPTPLCARATVTIAVSVNLVIAADDAANTPQNTAAVINILANDTATTNPLDPASVSITAAPANGTVTVSAAGVATYTPKANYSGPDSFSYQVCDTSAPTRVCDRAVVSINVAANSVSAQDDNASTEQNKAVSIALLANDSAASAPLDPASVKLLTQPANGTVSFNSDGSITYTPQPNFAGDDSFSYQVCDTSNPTPVCDSAIVRVIVKDVIPPPVAVNDTRSGMEPGTPVTVDVLANDRANGDSLDPASVRLVGTGGAGQPLTVVGQGEWSINGTTGAISFVPEDGFTGDPSPVQYQVANSFGELSNPATVTLDYLQNFALLMVKTATPQVAKVGDLIRYTVTVKNTGNANIRGATLVDRPPAGFTFVPGSLRVTDDDNNTLLTGSQPLRIEGVDIRRGQSATLVYLLRIGAGAGRGEHVNHITGLVGTDVVSNDGKAAVLIQADPDFEQATIVGSVFNDRDGDGWQDAATASGLKAQGGFAPGAYVPGSTTVNGRPAADASAPLLHGLALGSLPGRASSAAAPQEIVISQRLNAPTLTDDFALGTAEGNRLHMAANGKQTLEQSGDAKRGLSVQQLEVSRELQPEGEGWRLTYRIRNTGIDERGLPGVRLATVEGLVVETDAYGRYHLEGIDVPNGLRGRNFIVKVDPASLPAGSRFSTGNPGLKRITQGLPARFDFGVQVPEELLPGVREMQELVLGEVLFAPGSAKLLPSFAAVMDNIAERVQTGNGAELVVTGEALQAELALARAMTVRDAVLARLPAEKRQALATRVQARVEVPKGQTLMRVGEGVLLGEVLFDFDKANIRPGYEALFRELAAAVEAGGFSHVQVIGHADERGTRHYNQALGQRRAEAVWKAIAEHLSPAARARLRVEYGNGEAAP